MKKILCLILTLCMCFGAVAALSSCGEEEVTDLFTYAAKLQPTRTTTFATYKIGADELSGTYVMEISGNNSIFTYEYDRYRTAEEAVEDNDPSPIKTISGKVYCKDGTYSDDGVIWGSSPVATEIKLKLERELLTNVVLSEDGNSLTAEITPENAKTVLGTDLNADGNIAITATANGTYLTGITVSCTTVQGAAVRIETSYSYNALELVFPE